jgi:septum formation protein
MDDIDLILASASPRRRSLLAGLGLPFRTVVSNTPETAAAHLTPREICLNNAIAKARAVARHHPRALILAADTEVALDHRVLGKPVDLAQAAEFLRRLSGRTHEVLTAVCLWRQSPRLGRSGVAHTRVTFQPLSETQITDYLARVKPLDKAGAYAIQEQGETIIEAIHGSLTNVVGLPLDLVRRLLAEAGAGPSERG